MSDSSDEAARESLAAGMLAIVVAGTVLGLLFNWIGLRSRPDWGVAWVGQDRASQMVSLDSLGGGGVQAAEHAPGAVSDDPMAMSGSAGSGVPQIPDLDRPIEASLEQVRRLHEADAALFLDAREADEYAEGHIAGALCVPFDVAAGDPPMLENLETGGKPLVVYCGGGACELSMNLAWELIYAGHSRVVVYMGGYPEWVAAGYPTETGGGAEDG